METIDLQFFLEPPELTVKGLLTIEALAPLSMVAAQPGKYYRTQSIPTNEMVYGMLENALGWHFGSMNLQIIENEITQKYDREKLMEKLKAIAIKKFDQDKKWENSKWLKEKAPKSGSGFVSLLSYHVNLNLLPDIEQTFLNFDDLWTRHQSQGVSGKFEGSSRHHDYRLEAILKRVNDKTLFFKEFSEKKDESKKEFVNKNDGQMESNYEFTNDETQQPIDGTDNENSEKAQHIFTNDGQIESEDELSEDETQQPNEVTNTINSEDDKRIFTIDEILASPEKKTLHKRHLKAYFPMYYNSPTLRGYVMPSKPYVFEIETTETLKKLLFEAVEFPNVPLYLGTNDGWVEATLRWKE